MKKPFHVATCSDCGQRDFCRTVEDGELCIECAADFGWLPAHYTVEGVRDMLINDQCDGDPQITE